jgi:hypothetical protein
MSGFGFIPVFFTMPKNLIKSHTALVFPEEGLSRGRFRSCSLSGILIHIVGELYDKTRCKRSITPLVYHKLVTMT